MVCGALGTAADLIDYVQRSPAWAEHYRAWSDNLHSGVGTDIALDDGGVWRWNSSKPEMPAHVAAYFTACDEDGVLGTAKPA